MSILAAMVGVIASAGAAVIQATQLLLNGNTLVDSSPAARTITNNSVTVNTTTKKFGTGSLYFSGATSYLTILGDGIGTGDFTVEMWVNKSGGTNNGIFQLCFSPTMPSTDSPLAIFIYPTTFGITSSGLNQRMSTITPTVGTWYHLAVVRYNGTLTFYINGAVAAGIPAVADTTDYSAYIYYNVGVYWDSGYTFNGYIDDVRISRTAKYTTTFTPPTAELT